MPKSSAFERLSHCSWKIEIFSLLPLFDFTSLIIIQQWDSCCCMYLEFALSFKASDAWKVTLLSCFHRLRTFFPVNMFLFKYLPQGLFRSQDANSNTLISRCYLAAGLGLRDTVKFPPGRRKNKATTKRWSRTSIEFTTYRSDVKI